MSRAPLIVSGLLEIGFAVGLKLSNGFKNLVPALVAIATGLASALLDLLDEHHGQLPC